MTEHARRGQGDAVSDGGSTPPASTILTLHKSLNCNASVQRSASVYGIRVDLLQTAQRGFGQVVALDAPAADRVLLPLYLGSNLFGLPTTRGACMPSVGLAGRKRPSSHALQADSRSGLQAVGRHAQGHPEGAGSDPGRGCRQARGVPYLGQQDRVLRGGPRSPGPNPAMPRGLPGSTCSRQSSGLEQSGMYGFHVRSISPRTDSCSRSCMGRDDYERGRIDGRQRFQSTRPHGARPAVGRFGQGLNAVSIHAPAWGATAGQRHGQGAGGVSIHAPAWGATGRGV